MKRWVWRFARRELVSGELTLLALALMLAVCAMSSVAFFSDRVQKSLTVRANQLLAADLVLSADAPLPEPLRTEAERRGLVLADSTTFPSMVMTTSSVALANFKAVSDSYPLRGQVTVRLVDGRVLQGAYRPAPGTAWADLRLLTRLGLRLGDRVGAGNRSLLLTGEIVREPDGALNLYDFIPRLMFNRADLAATGLIVPGTRARWRLMLRGDAPAVSAYADWVRDRLPRGARIENVEEARPEVREAMVRARRFLGLTAMLSVTLAAAAVSLAVRRYLTRHWQAVAVLRCLGLSSGEVVRLFGLLLCCTALMCGAVGALAGYGLQALLTRVALPVPAGVLPAPDLWLGLFGPPLALVLLGGLALPPLAAVRRVPPLAVLREELGPVQGGLAAPLAFVLTLLVLAFWQLNDFRLALWMFAGMAGFLLFSGVLAAFMLACTRLLAHGRGAVGWRFGVASLARRPWLAILQVVALSAGLMALLTLTVVRDDLLSAWRHSIPPDAPNQFAINLQPAQASAFRAVFTAAGRTPPELAPMLRARLVAINQRAVSPSSYQDGEARRLAEREFNLSWRDSLPPSNRIVAGNWWHGREQDEFSVEQGLAQKLGIALGDSLSFDIAGTRIDGQVTSLRSVAWDSFQVNFFVLAPKRMLDGQMTSLISSFYLPPDRQAFASTLVHTFPNLTLIDVSEVLAELRDVAERLAHAVEAMFLLAVMAGVLVLWAALGATRDERMADAALLRALGASRRQVRAAVLGELVLLGAFTGLAAGIGAMGLGALVADKLFDLPWLLNWQLPPLGMVSGMLLVPLAGWPLIRPVLRRAPAEVLRSL
jgi:putative ABC transport system permease protein